MTLEGARAQRGYIGGYSEGTLAGTLGDKSGTLEGTNPVQGYRYKSGTLEGTNPVHRRVQPQNKGAAEHLTQGAKEVRE